MRVGLDRLRTAVVPGSVIRISRRATDVESATLRYLLLRACRGGSPVGRVRSIEFGVAGGQGLGDLDQLHVQLL